MKNTDKRERTPIVGEWRGEDCKRCGRRNIIGFKVSDEVWDKVIGDSNTVRCPTCFDMQAQIKGVKYSFEELFPVTWNDWIE